MIRYVEAEAPKPKSAAKTARLRAARKAASASKPRKVAKPSKRKGNP
jgi:hypothetical protein